MSLIKSLVSGAKKILRSPAVAAVSKFIPGPVGLAVAGATTAYSAYQGMKARAPSIPGIGSGFQNMGMPVPSFSSGFMPALGAAGGAAVRIGVAGAKRVYSSAASYCRKHPGWCQTIGGIAAVEALIQSGQLPPVKSRRGRGITATEFKHFKRVARITSKYCAPVRKAMSSRALRGGKSCR